MQTMMEKGEGLKTGEREAGGVGTKGAAGGTEGGGGGEAEGEGGEGGEEGEEEGGRIEQRRTMREMSEWRGNDGEFTLSI